MDDQKPRDESEIEPTSTDAEQEGATQSERADETPNPPHTTTGKITSPKFGSAGSGGLELDPGYERN